MITISNYKPWIIRLHGYDHWFAIRQRIDFLAIYDSLHLQETKQYLVLSLQHYVKRSRNS